MASLPVNLQPDEHLIVRVRRHPMFLLTQMLAVLVFGVIPAVVLFMWSATAGDALIVVAALWGIIALMVAYFIWYRHQHNEWIITDQRLIDAQKQHWFDQQLVSTDLIQIENMAVSKSGFLQTIFNYGDLRCETAGQHATFMLRGIPDPSGVLDTVDTARDEARRELASAASVLQAT